MAHIKRLVMSGFKSFAKKTEIIFDDGINVVVGPNGSGKSNITDALCFVLGRLSIKSMRAAKAKNLIFMGSKYVKPSHEAYVEIIFDNADRKIGLDSEEIVIKRAVRHNGTGVYKINGETKTRTEVIEILAHAGIDPYGFNIILQGEIQSIVKMHAEERRKIIEEVAGISIYEARKEKSLRELEKTDERLKEIGTVLRERTAYLNNLEKEKAQAQKYQELKNLSARVKASILKKKIDEKTKEIDSIVKSISEKTAQRDKKANSAEKIQEEINSLGEKINQINKYIQKATGLEQGTLREEITNLRAELEGLKVRHESYENKKTEIEKRIEGLKKTIPEMESEIKSLREKSPLMARKAAELKRKKDELAELEKERKKLISVKTEATYARERAGDRQKQLARAAAESESLVRQIEEISEGLNYSNEKECCEALVEMKKKVSELKEKTIAMRKEEVENEKVISVSESEIKRNEEIKKKVSQIEICPLCQSEMTETHVKHIFRECDGKIERARREFDGARNALEIARENRKNIVKEVEEFEKKIYSCDREISVHRAIAEKKLLIKKAVENEKVLRDEIRELEKKMAALEQKNLNAREIETKYGEKLAEIEEISSRTEEDIDTTLLYKERELEKTRKIIEQSAEDLEEIEQKISDAVSKIEEKERILDDKETKEEELNEKFRKMYEERDKMQKQTQEENVKLVNAQNEARGIEEQVNYLRIGKAKFDSERETLEIDFEDYRNFEIVAGSLNYLEERLEKTNAALETIGSINMRALEVYESVKKEYDLVREKVETLDKEKTEILKIIEEIDRKKTKTFMKTFNAINELFSENFVKLMVKNASAYLEIENKEDIFAGGVNIVVKMGKGKYFDATSLSGGEKTIVALSLLFAIQEYRPYQFYVLDEIDAALDRRNSERLAALLNQYMKSGQYIIITHNDAVILNSQLLYGVSMHEGVSKILSLNLGGGEKV